MENLEAAKVDALLDKIDACVVNVSQTSGNIKRQKYESDLLSYYGMARDHLEAALKADRKMMQDVYGGDCMRISRLVTTLTRQRFSSKGAISDQRTQMCRSMCDVVTEVLRDMGLADRLRAAMASADDVYTNLVTKSAEKVVVVQEVTMQQLDVQTTTKNRSAVAVDPNKPFTKEDVEASISDDFVKMIDEASTLDEFAKISAPDKQLFPGNWLIWMVHRVHLNDPTLDTFNIRNVSMPDPVKESRIAPKLVTAIAHNTHLVDMCLANANFRPLSCKTLATSLETNNTLRVLNIDSNELDVAAIIAIAAALENNSCMEELRANNQFGSGFSNSTARAVEQSFAEMLKSNKVLCKLGFSFSDAHWRNTIDRAIIRNNDQRRKRRLQQKAEEEKAAETEGEESQLESPRRSVSVEKSRAPILAVTTQPATRNRVESSQDSTQEATEESTPMAQLAESTAAMKIEVEEPDVAHIA